MPATEDLAASSARRPASLIAAAMRSSSSSMSPAEAPSAVGSMRRHVPETVAKLTGGEYYSFKDEKGLDKSLHELSNHVPNRYMLSFTPAAPHVGLHALTLTLKDRPGLKVDARTSYWAEGDAAPAK